MRRLLLVVGLTGLLSSACTTTQKHTGIACDFGPVKFTKNFEGAHLNSCRRNAEGQYELVIRPENTPINPSAWYAFDVTAPKGKPLTFVLAYEFGKHRYIPKIKDKNMDWVRLPDQGEITNNKTRARFTFKPSEKITRIAAQPVFDNAKHKAWIDNIAQLDFVSVSSIGQSVEGRKIYKLETSTVRDVQKPYIFLVGRQHPPETTGADALMPFVETVFGDTDIANEFREHFNVIVVPNLNPDGVAHGHWRHNMAGVDLNRDWGPFTQPETQAIRNELKRFANKKQRLALFVDFHSTWRNLFYTQADEEITIPKDFAKIWLSASDKLLNDQMYTFTREARHNSGKPTSKNYMFSTYAIPAITYEVGDTTSQQAISESAHIFAQEMMKLMVLNMHEVKLN